MNIAITPRKKTDRGGYYCMPLLSNVPVGRAHWKLVRCPECGAKCWRMPHAEYLEKQGGGKRTLHHVCFEEGSEEP